ncbi:MAG: hypothetical protein HQK97_09195 [Nitrospirae bacterium]|nr:hypothetical protein [Nitrospirota bacterium]
MGVSKADLVFVKSATVTDTNANGGRKSYSAIANRQKFNLFPRVTRPERMAGITRYRKEFLWNKNASLETAFSVLAYMLLPSPAGDRFYLAAGTQSDAQGDIDASYQWAGGGALNSAITAGAQAVSIMFKNNDYAIDNAKTLVINSHFLTGQTIDAGVKAFDAVYYDGSKWIAQSAPNSDAEDVYPYGTYLGSNKVFSYNSNGNIEYLITQNNSYTNEILYAGNGSQTVFTGQTTDHTPVKANTASVKYTIGGQNYTATDNGSGAITGTSISSGTINYESGAVAVTLSAAPDNSTNITIDYTERCYSWSGNVATIKTVEQLANNYATANTYCGVAITLGDIKTSVSNKAITGSGAFDETKIVLDNIGTVDDTWTLTFTSATAFNCVGTLEGSVGTGAINSAFTPTNANTGQKYLQIPANAWSGTWATGNTLQIKTGPAAATLWLKEVVPAGTGAFSENGTLMEIYVE